MQLFAEARFRVDSTRSMAMSEQNGFVCLKLFCSDIAGRGARPLAAAKG